MSLKRHCHVQAYSRHLQNKAARLVLPADARVLYMLSILEQL
jgi:hypothetical protein